MRAVRFDHYGDVDVLDVREVEDPQAAPGRVLVEVRAAGTNPGEIAIREGRLDARFPATFPSGEGSDLAGVVRVLERGADSFAVGEEVLGWSEERSSHAELVSVPAEQLTPKPPAVPWEVAGSLFVAGMAALASVESVAPKEGETVAVSAAAGGVGSLAAQLAVLRGARVIGLASEGNHDWLRAHGIVPVTYGDGQGERIREAAPDGIDAFVDTFGGGYVELAIDLGVPPARINTIIDFGAVERFGVKGEGTHSIATAERLAGLAGLVAEGRLEVPIARTYPLEQVRDASGSSNGATRTARSCSSPDAVRRGRLSPRRRSPRRRIPDPTQRQETGHVQIRVQVELDPSPLVLAQPPDDVELLVGALGLDLRQLHRPVSIDATAIVRLKSWVNGPLETWSSSGP